MQAWRARALSPMVIQALAGCALLVACVLFQPRHKTVELLGRRAAARALRADAAQNKATLQALQVCHCGGRCDPVWC